MDIKHRTDDRIASGKGIILGRVMTCFHERAQRGEGAGNGVRAAGPQVRHVAQRVVQALARRVRQRVLHQLLLLLLGGRGAAVIHQENVLQSGDRSMTTESGESFINVLMNCLLIHHAVLHGTAALRLQT